MRHGRGVRLRGVSELGDYITERNAALSTGDLDVVITHMIKWGLPAVTAVAKRATLEVAMHKAITACVDLDMARRAESKAWLMARGYEPHDDGDVREQ
jgi:hypothetical protein